MKQRLIIYALLGVTLAGCHHNAITGRKTVKSYS